MTIWIVEGNTGEYEYYDEWIAKAFLSKDKAEEFMTKCIEYAKYMIEKIPDPDENEDSIYPRYYFEEYNSHDPNFRVDYTGTFYRLYELDVEE